MDGIKPSGFPADVAAHKNKFDFLVWLAMPHGTGGMGLSVRFVDDWFIWL